MQYALLFGTQLLGSLVSHGRACATQAARPESVCMYHIYLYGVREHLSQQIDPKEYRKYQRELSVQAARGVQLVCDEIAADCL